MNGSGNELFREAMGRLGTAVTIVTTEVDSRPWGVTVSACCSLSLEPPLLLVSLLRKTVAGRTMATIGSRFGVSVLKYEQSDVAHAGAATGVPKFFERYVSFDPVGKTYMVNDPMAHLHCVVDDAVVAGDHIILIGKVEDVTLGRLDAPLLHFYRRFGGFSDSDLTV